MIKNFKLIGAEFGFGAQLRDTALGPAAIKAALEPKLQESYIGLSAAPEYGTPKVGKESFPAIVEFCHRLADATYQAVQEGCFPITLGGDHSIAMGSWRGIIKALNADGKFGLIWIDAHMDSHTYENSVSKAYHGMPLAALMGHGDEALKGNINPSYVAVVGARSYEPEEKLLLEELGVKVFYASEVHARGLNAVLAEAKSIANQANGGFGASLDLDFFDPKFAPGVGSPEPGGFDPEEFLACIEVLMDDKLKGFEIVELNPNRDVDSKTTQIASRVIECITNNNF
jgi:arginase